MLFILLESSSLLSVNPGLIFWTVVTFLLLLFILQKLAWKPIISAVENREKRIQESLDRAEKMQQEAEEKLTSYQKMLEDAKKETQEILSKGRKTAEVVREEILSKSNEEARRLLEKAKKDISLEREKALADIRNLAVDLSLSAASRLVERSLTEDDQKKIVANYLKEIKIS
ncbi:MAG TPA: ATP synthase F0 subunit B [Bacteroidetes bacterium]|nr:ATP synthase F0 subunit B [Bacteroidota bacterium]